MLLVVATEGQTTTNDKAKIHTDAVGNIHLNTSQSGAVLINGQSVFQRLESVNASIQTLRSENGPMAALANLASQQSAQISTLVQATISMTNHIASLTSSLNACTGSTEPITITAAPTTAPTITTPTDRTTLLAFGGLTGTGTAASAEKLALSSSSWVATTDPLTVRQGSGVAVATALNKVFVVGGGALTGEVLGNVEIYDQQTKVWTAGAAMSKPRFYLGVAIVNDCLYAIGGNTQASGATSTTERYNITSNTWAVLAPLPSARKELVAVAVGQYIFAIGGTTTSRTDLVTRYDTRTDVWETRTRLPIPTTAAAGCAIDGYIYVVGGYTGVSTTAVYRYDPNADTWTSMTSSNMPTARHYLSLTAHESSFYAVGGFTAVVSRYQAAVEQFDTVTGNWTSLPSMSTARYGLTVILV